jgi:transposase
MLRALIEGKATPEEMAKLARGALKKKTERLVLALQGRLEDHHRFLLQVQLERVERIEGDVRLLDDRIDQAIEPHQGTFDLLVTIPGVDRIAAITLIAELGTDMTIFPSAGQAAAWAGVCPGNNESAGKRLGHAKRRGNAHLCSALVQAAFGASQRRGPTSRSASGDWPLAAGRSALRWQSLTASSSLRTR